MITIQPITADHITLYKNKHYFGYADFDGCRWAAVIETRDARHLICADTTAKLLDLIKFYI